MTDRTRGVLVLLVTFLAGGLAGAAADRWYANVAVHRDDNETVANDRIPTALAQLDLTAAQERGLRDVARRWRPQAGVALQEMRRKVSVMENEMVAEMLCLLSEPQRERYRANIQARMDSAVVAKRFSLVRGGGCAMVTDTTRH